MKHQENYKNPEHKHTTARLPEIGPPAETGPLRLTNDFLFKRVFGSRHTQDILLAFVNAVLSDAEMPTAVRLTVTNPELPKDASWLKTAVLDISAVDTSGRSFDIEVQVARRAAFAERSLAYWAKLYVEQSKGGDAFSALRPVVCINVVDHVLFPKLPVAHSCFHLTEKNHHRYVLSDHISIHFLELEKPVMSHSSLGRWMRYIDREGVMSKEEMESLLQDEAIRRAHEEYQKVIEDPQERRWAWARQVYQMDRNDEIIEAKREGREEGAHGRAVENARRFLKMGYSVQDVAAGTALPTEEVLRLLDESV